MPRPTLLALLLWVLLASRVPAEQASLQSALPGDWIALVAVAHPTETLDRVGPLLAAAEVSLPEQLGDYLQLLADLDGLDQTGQFVAGLVESSGGRLQPFVLLPATDHDTLVESFDGDPQLDQPILNLDGQRVVAIRQGDWLALCSEEVAEDFAGSQLASPVPLLGKTMTVAIRPAAWRSARTIGNQLKQADNRWYNRVRRMSAGGNWIPRSRDGAIDFLLTALPVIDQMATEEIAVAWACDLAGREYKSTLRLSVESPRESANSDASSTTPAQLLDNTDPIASLVGSIPQVWRRQLTEGVLRWQMSTSEESILHRGRSRYYERFIETCSEIAAQSEGIQAVAAVPPDGLPPMSNQAMVITCSDSAQLVDSIEQAFDIWNQMVTIEMRLSKLLFEKSDVEIAGIVATRYSADLQAAFLAGDVPDVRTIMTKLFGPPGDLVYTVVPLDAHHVLVSQWREEQTTAIVAGRSPATTPSKPSQPLRFAFSPQSYRRWKAQQYAIEFADQPYAPKAHPIGNSDTVEATAKGDSQQLTISLSAPADLVNEWLGAAEREE